MAKDIYRYEYGCLMAAVSIKDWAKILDLVADEDLYSNEKAGFGKERKPHVTILFGFHDKKGTVDKIKTSLPVKSGIELSISGISHFSGAEYDVVKFSVSSPDLKELNSWCKEEFEHTSDFPDYQPHMTIAYVKKGLGAKYERKMKNNVVIQVEEVFYSHPDHSENRWNIT